MIGDRKYDILGAKSAKIDSIGVEFGYAEEGELVEAGAIMITYDKVVNYWDQVFNKEEIVTFNTTNIGHESLNKALDWLCEDSDRLLDFGCGNGTMLFKCALRGSSHHIGIDLSKEGINLAKKRQEVNATGHFKFIQGDCKQLKEIQEQSCDGAILSNVLDNLVPEDSVEVINEVHRILKSKGKVFLKLNPFLTEEQIQEWNIKVIKDELL